MIKWECRSTVPAAKAFDFVADLARKGIDCYQHAIKNGMVLIEWGRTDEASQQTARGSSLADDCGA